MTAWHRRDLLVAFGDGPKTQRGHVYGEIGMFAVSPKRWSVIHLNTGLALGLLRGRFSAIKLLVERIANLTDWSFDAPMGWRNSCPEMPDRLRALLADSRRNGTGSTQYEPSCAWVSQRIAEARLGVAA